MKGGGIRIWISKLLESRCKVHGLRYNTCQLPSKKDTLFLSHSLPHTHNQTNKKLLFYFLSFPFLSFSFLFFLNNQHILILTSCSCHFSSGNLIPINLPFPSFFSSFQSLIITRTLLFSLLFFFLPSAPNPHTTLFFYNTLQYHRWYLNKQKKTYINNNSISSLH